MRVLLAGSGKIPVPPPAYGAVERHVAALADALRRRGHDVDVFAPVLGGRAREFRFARLLHGRWRETRPDVLHVHTTAPAAVLGALGVPFVYTSHSRHWRTVEGWRERAGFALEKYGCRKARAVLALAPGVRDLMLEEGIRPRVVPNGVDLERFRPGPRPPGRPLRVLSVGEVREHKGMHVAAEATRDLDAEYRVVGPVRDPLYAKRLEGPHVRIVGPVPDEELAAEYADADVFAHLSVSEALSMAVLEAMAAGLPLVASDVCEGQIEDGANGFAVKATLSEEARVAAARAALARLAEDSGLRARFGAESRRLAGERYSWDAVAARVEEAYAAAKGGEAA